MVRLDLLNTAPVELFPTKTMPVRIGHTSNGLDSLLVEHGVKLLGLANVNETLRLDAACSRQLFRLVESVRHTLER